MPVGWTWLLLYLLLNPLQIDCDKSLEALTVTGLRREGPTVIHQSVHPVFIDELNQAEKRVLHYIKCNYQQTKVFLHRGVQNNADLRCDCGFHSSSSVSLETVIVMTAGGDLQESPAKESKCGNKCKSMSVWRLKNLIIVFLPCQ